MRVDDIARSTIAKIEAELHRRVVWTIVRDQKNNKTFIQLAGAHPLEFPVDTSKGDEITTAYIRERIMAHFRGEQ